MTYYAFRVAPNHEARAHKALEAAGVASLFAHELIEVRRRNPQRRIEIERIEPRPLLIGYAIARHAPAEPLAYWLMRIRSLSTYGGATRGHLPVVRSVVGPIVGGEAALDHLMARSGSVVALPRARKLGPGDVAQVTDGPYAGHTITIEAIAKSRARVVIGSLNIGAVSIDLAKLEAA